METAKDFFDRRTGEFRQVAIDFREMAIRIDKAALLFDDRGVSCEGCGATTYLFFDQRLLRQRVTGVSERLRTIADECERRARDPHFIGEPAGAISPSRKMVELGDFPKAESGGT